VPPSTIPDTAPRLAVIRYDDGDSVEALLTAFVAARRAEGVRVAGLLQESGREANGRPRMELIDIVSGRRILISQNLGGDSRACCVDVAGIASAAACLRQALESAPDLLVINKFSGLEAKGGGLWAEFLDALAAGLPVLTGLSGRHDEAFAALTGGLGEFLPASLSALEAWWRRRADAAPPGQGRRAG
jgi:nucleoside-triphosphatase THEP1